VDADKGLELLLAEPIYIALANGDGETLKQLEERYSDGFWAVLEIVASTKLDGTDATTISKAGVCLKKSRLLDQSDRLEAVTVIGAIRHAAESIKQWSPFDKTMADGVSALCQLQNEATFSQTALKAVAAAFSGKGSDSKEAPSKPEVIVDALLSVFRSVASLKHEGVFPKSFTLPVDAEAWSSICQHLSKSDVEGQFLQRIRPRVEFSEIVSSIQITISNGQFSQQHITTLRITHASPMKSPWNEVVTAMRQRLDAGLNIACNESHSLLTGLCELRRLESGEATSALKDLVDGGHILHHFQRATSENHADCRAVCAFTFLRERPGVKKPTAVGDSDAGYQTLISALASEDKSLATPFMKHVQRYGELEMLLKVVDARSQYDALIGECLREVAEGKSPETLFTPTVILERWQDLEEVLKDTEDDTRFTSLLGRLARDTNLCQSIQDREGGFSADEAELYLAMMEGAKEEIPAFSSWCKQGLEHLDQGVWNADLSGSYACTRLTLDLAKQSRAPELKTAFSDALETHSKSVVGGEYAPPVNVRLAWEKLLDCLVDEATRKVLRTRLVDVAASQNGKLHEVFIEMYSEEIDLHFLKKHQ
ncbi:MAG: hypothetical protein IH899_05315, partial [Planctomycetes bacterium]|nr:hypothetical protein [Planctomycetota bacterium]